MAGTSLMMRRQLIERHVPNLGETEQTGFDWVVLTQLVRNRR
jgi:hypothetical protein